MNCQRCGAPLVPGNAFCGSCGSPVAAQQPPAYAQGYGAPPPPPPPQGGYPPQQYQQYQQPYPQAPQPQYAAPQPAYGAPMAYQPVGAPGWVFFGYVFALLGGLIGLGIGGWLWGAKVDDPYGNKVKKFKGSTRFHGMVIMILGSVNMALIRAQMG